jgi:hypothetical protein
MLHTFLQVLLKMGIFNTLGFGYLYKGGGLDIRTTNFELASILVLLGSQCRYKVGLDIRARSQYPFMTRGLGIDNVRIKFVR